MRLIHHMQKNNEKTNIGPIAGLNEYVDLDYMEWQTPIALKAIKDQHKCLNYKKRTTRQF